MKYLFDRQTLSWAFYDWANSAYATIVLAVFFPLVFSNYWFAGSGSENSTTPLGIANSGASLLIILLAPILGAIADKGGIKKKFLFAFAAIGIVAHQHVGPHNSVDFFFMQGIQDCRGQAGANRHGQKGCIQAMPAW